MNTLEMLNYTLCIYYIILVIDIISYDNWFNSVDPESENHLTILRYIFDKRLHYTILKKSLILT